MTAILHAISDLDQALSASADPAYDAVVLVIAPGEARCGVAKLDDVVNRARAADAAIDRGTTVLPVEGIPSGRLVLAATGPVDRDADDVRRFADAAAQGVERARAAGAKRPMVVLPKDAIPTDCRFEFAVETTALAAIGAVWQPLEGREAAVARTDRTCPESIEAVGFHCTGSDSKRLEQVVAEANAIEAGRYLARDLGGTEPERMAPPRFAEMCQEAFRESDVKVTVIDDLSAIEEDYPLLAGVARASFPVKRHHPRIVRLEWQNGTPEQTLLLAGKGVTYDTGGADIKAGGHMAGMSRDKGGAASVAGFVAAIAALKPNNVRVVAELGIVRNSVGAECYVSDEILTSHAGCRVRIANTDAEGRLVLADCLSHLREVALTAESPRLFSVATLTGHAARAVGNYTAVLDNEPARQRGTAQSMADAGDRWGDPCDVSRLRREDWDFVAPRTSADDVLSCNNAPSTLTARGHQFPMAFLAIASGLVNHSRSADLPLPFTHVDIAGSFTQGGDCQHGRPTGAPIVALLKGIL